MKLDIFVRWKGWKYNHNKKPHLVRVFIRKRKWKWKPMMPWCCCEVTSCNNFQQSRCQAKIIHAQSHASAHETGTVVQQGGASFIPWAAVQGLASSGTDLGSSCYLAESETAAHHRNGRTVTVQFCWLCYSPVEVLINANCKRGSIIHSMVHE